MISPPITAPNQSPTPIPPANKITPRGGIGYFNYDPTDKDCGVGERVERNGKVFYENMGWHRVKENPEHNRWKELWSIHRRDLSNRCKVETKQSPIDLCDTHINYECREHHQTRTHVRMHVNITFVCYITPFYHQFRLTTLQCILLQFN